MPEYYFFFDSDGMPIAVFLVNSKAKAFELFARLYRRSWSESYKLGITIKREADVPVERWYEIHRNYIARIEKSKPVMAPAIRPVKLSEIKKSESTGLETEKYMSRM